MPSLVHTPSFVFCKLCYLRETMGLEIPDLYFFFFLLGGLIWSVYVVKYRICILYVRAGYQWIVPSSYIAYVYEWRQQIANVED